MPLLRGVTDHTARSGQAAAPSILPGFGEQTAAATGRGWWVVVGAWAAMLVLQGLTGQTPGRRVMDIHVVRAPVGGPVGGPPGVLRSFGRWFAHLVDAVLLIGYLRPLWHPERRIFADSCDFTDA